MSEGPLLNAAQVRGGDRIDWKADEDERARIAERLHLLALERFEAHAVLEKDGAAILAEGRVRAVVEQACIASGEPVRADIDEPFALRFLPEPGAATPDEEVELGEDELDTIFMDGGKVALGDALVDTLALALDPYPRSAQAEETLRAAGVISEEEAGPFGALADLKAKLERGSD